ncbi:metal-dependent transcriptional regulator [bacterium]|nr:metal-dependent transcriptional regulator [candidate division CSSED10-310 bacterium]
MTAQTSLSDISINLQEYLEIVYQLIRDKGAARIRDLARAKRVSTSAVITALRRLNEAGLVNYAARELVTLTEQGRRLSHKLEQRHQFLARFLHNVLGLENQLAEQEACNLEHHLSVVTLERLEAFFEFINSCPRGGVNIVEQFRQCHPERGRVIDCHVRRRGMGAGCLMDRESTAFLGDLAPGETGRVLQLRGNMPFRRRLVDLGILPGTIIQVVRYAPLGDPIELKIMDYFLSLRRVDARGILVEKLPAGSVHPQEA